MQIAGFEKRLMAYLVDGFINMALSVVFFIFVIHMVCGMALDFWLFFIPTVATIFYILSVGFMLYHTNGLTIGNMIFGLKTVSIKFQKLTLRQVFVKILPLSIIPCVIINGLYMLFKHTEKTLFDELSHTISISIR